MKSKILFSLLALTLATGCGAPGAKSGVVKGGERSSGFMGLSKTDDIVVDNADAFKGSNQIVVANFVVGFATYKTDSSKAGGGLMGSGFGGKSTAKSSLLGIDDATMQKITEAAYTNFVADMKAKGYTLADRNALLNFADFKRTKTYENPYEDSSGGLFGTSSKTKYFAPASFGSIRSFVDVPGLSGGFAFDNAIAGAASYVKSGGPKVVSVVYVLDFANSEKYGSWATSTSSVSVGQGLTVIPEYTKITLIGGEGGSFSNPNGSVRLGQPITSEKEFATVTDSTSDAAKGVEIATNVIGIMGGVGSNSSREFEFKARPADFTAAANDVLKQTNSALIGKMSTLK